MIEEQMIHAAGPRRLHPARIDQDTPIVPAAVAAAVWEEARVSLDTELPSAWIGELTRRAETVYARNPRWRRRLRRAGNRGRDCLWAFTRHWLAALICKHRPELYPRLPADYSVGQDPPARRPG